MCVRSLQGISVASDQYFAVEDGDEVVSTVTQQLGEHVGTREQGR